MIAISHGHDGDGAYVRAAHDSARLWRLGLRLGVGTGMATTMARGFDDVATGFLYLLRTGSVNVSSDWQSDIYFRDCTVRAYSSNSCRHRFVLTRTKRCLAIHQCPGTAGWP